MIPEETPTEFSPRASAEPMQAPVPEHHRFFHTQLWKIVHEEMIDGLPCENGRDAEENNHTNQPATNGSAQAGISAALDDFLCVLTNYCRNETNLTERLRTLRVIHCGLATAVKWRDENGAEKKCACPLPLRYSYPIHRCRVRNHSH